MAQYLVLYLIDPQQAHPVEDLSADEREAGKAAWGAWGAKAGEALVSFGAPTVSIGVSAEREGLQVSGYTLLHAECESELWELLATHPHAQVGTFEVHAHLTPPAE